MTLWQAAATIAAAEAVLTSATTGGTAAPELPRIPLPRLTPGGYALTTTDPSSK